MKDFPQLNQKALEVHSIRALPYGTIDNVLPRYKYLAVHLGKDRFLSNKLGTFVFESDAAEATLREVKPSKDHGPKLPERASARFFSDSCKLIQIDVVPWIFL